MRLDVNQGEDCHGVLCCGPFLMKKSSLTLFSVSTIALLALAGCGKTDKAADAPAASASSTPAATAPAAAKPAEGRAIAITADDTMKFSTTEIHAKPGEALSVTLTNAGSVPKFSMGHNWVLLTANSDLNAFPPRPAKPSRPTTCPRH